MKTIFSEKPTLEGEKVILRPFCEADISTMLEILEDVEVRRLTGSVLSTAEANEPMPEAEKERTVAWYRSRNGQTDRLDLAIVSRATGATVGEVVLNEWDADCERCNFRILIGPKGRNGGLGSEATQMTVDYAFDVLGLHRVDLTVFDFNPRGRRVYEKAGFVQEGIRREMFRYDGVWHDEYIYSILASDRKAKQG